MVLGAFLCCLTLILSKSQLHGSEYGPEGGSKIKISDSRYMECVNNHVNKDGVERFLLTPLHLFSLMARLRYTLETNLERKHPESADRIWAQIGGRATPYPRSVD